MCLCVARALDYPLNSADTSPYMQKALDRKLINTTERGTDTERDGNHGMEEMLSGRDTGAIGCANQHCLSCLAMP